MTFERFAAPSEQLDWTFAQAPLRPPGSHAERISEVRHQIDLVERRRRPEGMSERRWHTLMKDARQFTAGWLESALAHHWPLLDLYGVPDPSRGRTGPAGVVLLLDGRSIDKIDANTIVIANRIGPPGVWRLGQNGTRAPHRMHGATLLWEAFK